MNISLVTIGFNQYGRFLGQWLAFASNMSPKPTEVIVVLGKNHGCKDIELMQSIYPDVKIYFYNKTATFGKLRNIAISKTSAEWTQFVSIDDKIQPDAIRTFKRTMKDQEADYIASQWYTIGLGLPLTNHRSPLPIEMARNVSSGGKGGGFVIPHSPFKRRLWEQHPYKNSDLPNYDFLHHCVVNGAKFIKADKPTTTYLRRPDSHARAILPKIRKQARKEKRIMQRGIIEYYKEEL